MKLSFSYEPITLMLDDLEEGDLFIYPRGNAVYMKCKAVNNTVIEYLNSNGTILVVALESGTASSVDKHKQVIPVKRGEFNVVLPFRG